MSNCHPISGITFLMGSWDKSKHSHHSRVWNHNHHHQSKQPCPSHSNKVTNVGRVHMLRFTELSTILQQGKIQVSLSISCHFIQNTLWLHPSLFLSEVLQVTNKLICINRDNILHLTTSSFQNPDGITVRHKLTIATMIMMLHTHIPEVAFTFHVCLGVPG